MTSNLQAHILLFTASLIQGFNFSIAKMVMPEYIAPTTIILIRGACASLFFIIVHHIFIKEKVASYKDLRMMAYCAVLGVAINQMLFYKGLSLTMPINASLMVTIVPMVVLIISWLFLKEMITLNKSLGILIGAAGVVLLLLSSSQEGPEEIFLGDILILVNACSYSFFLVMAKPLMSRYHPFTVLKWMFFLGFFMVLPFGWEGILQVDWAHMPMKAWLALAFVVVMATMVTYSLNIGVLRVVSPTLSGIYIYMQPVLATIVAILLGTDTFTWPKAIFSCMILSGVYLVSKRPAKA